MTRRDDIGETFRTHYRRMFNYALTLVRDEETARDIVQDVFASLAETEAGSSIPATFLLIQVRNRCCNWLRHLSVRERVERHLLIESESSAESPDLFSEETLNKIRETMECGLPPRCATVMKLRFESGMTYDEIADELQITTVAVYKHLCKGLAILREKLSRYGEI